MSQFINTQAQGDHVYKVFFNNRAVFVYAPTQYDAVLRGREYFRPSKARRYDVHAVIVQNADGEQVVHSTAGF